MESTHNPGSREAHDEGCICPIMDNNGGKLAPFPPDGWYIYEDCPVHGPQSTAGHERQAP